MTDQELEALLNDIESDRVERTEALADGDKFRQAVCAFANDLSNHQKAGVLFIGVNTKGEPIGANITDQLLQNLASMRGDGNILPFVSMDTQKRRLKNQDVAVVIVHPSDAAPVRFKGVVWIRSGPRRGIANPDDERRLNEKRRFRDVPHDIRPIASANIDDIDKLLFRHTYLPSAIAIEVLDQNQRSIEHQLIATKFAHPCPQICLTVLGVLVVGKVPTNWIPGDYAQLLRIDGTTLSDAIIAAQEFRGPLPELLAQAESALKLNIRTAIDLTSQTTEIKTPDYPLESLQQIFRNAILHRTYENTNAPVNIYWFNDRIEIHNPGGPYGQVTKKNFGSIGMYDYRNPNLAAVMKELAYVQHFGVGIEICRRAMKRNGNPDPEFQIEDGHVAVILRRRI
ncbi:MAG: ATP-binding protein [Planctomycetota bacterium]